MKTNGLARLYDQLTPRERLPLLLAAAARGDDAEADRLANSAPRGLYRLPDYHGLGEGLTLLLLLHVQTLLDRAANFWLVTGLAEGQALAWGDGEKDPPAARRLEGVARMWAYLFGVEADAWGRLMAELHIDPDSLLRDLPFSDTIRQAEEALRPVAFSEEEATAFLRERHEGARPVTVETVLADMRLFLDRCVERWD
jgi:hypothetical protein